MNTHSVVNCGYELQVAKNIRSAELVMNTHFVREPEEQEQHTHLMGKHSQ